MFKKTAIITAALFTLLMSSPAIAAPAGTDSQIPEMNPFCWHRKDCHTIRKTFLAKPPSCTVGDPSCKELEQGFITAGVDPCTGGTGEDQWGRCLPAGTSKTEISFGGRDEFTNIGDFIVLMYKYLVTIASIVAVVVIIIAGLQWITSGGNSEAISSAKKRIGGAIIGLFIAYMSYFVLNTINPALVNLRLPQVWLVKPIALMPEFCSEIPGAKEGTLGFMAGAGPTDAGQAKPLTLETVSDQDKKLGYIWKLNKNPNLFYCGMRLFADGGGDSTCRGSLCNFVAKEGARGGGWMPTCFDKKSDKNYECGTVIIGGKITYNTLLGGSTVGNIVAGVLTDNWDTPPIADTKLYAVCNKIQPSPVTPIGKGFVGRVLVSAAKGASLGLVGGTAVGTAVVPGVGTVVGGVVGTVGGTLVDVTVSVTESIWDDAVKSFYGRAGNVDINGRTFLVGSGHIEGNNYYVESGVESKPDPIGQASGNCGAFGGFRGFVLQVQMNQNSSLNEWHYIGQGGVDLGENSQKMTVGQFFSANAHNVKPEFLFTEEEARKGIHLPLDAGKIYYSYGDVDKENARYADYYIGE